MDRKDSKIKFVGLHAHSVAGSIFDAIGYPQDHMDFAYENGCDALRTCSVSLFLSLSFYLCRYNHWTQFAIS